MPTYEVSETHFFRETGTKVEAGDTVELTEAEAEAKLLAHPGLLKPVRQTTQAHPKAVRKTVDAPKRRTRARR